MNFDDVEFEAIPDDYTEQSSTGSFDDVEFEAVPYEAPMNVEEFKAQQDVINPPPAIPSPNQQTEEEPIVLNALRNGFTDTVNYIKRVRDEISDPATVIGRAATILTGPITRDREGVANAISVEQPQPTQDEPAKPSVEQEVGQFASDALAMASKPFPVQIVESIYDITKDASKWGYIAQGAWQESLTGSVVRGSFEREIEKDMEDQLGFKDKLLMHAMAMGPDFWLFGMGGTIPKMVKGSFMLAPAGFRSLPVIQQTGAYLESGLAHSASSFGFFEGIRTIYSNMMMKDGEEGKLKFIELMGKALHDAESGAAIGSLLKAGQTFRGGLFNGSPNAWEGFAKTMGVLPGEAAAIALVQSQLHNPGVLPGKEDFLMSAAMMLGFEGMTQFSHLKRRLHSDEIIAKLNTIYKRNGASPEAVAALAQHDVSVVEDLNNPMRQGRLRTLEKDATGKDIPNEPNVDGLLRMYDGAESTAPKSNTAVEPQKDATSPLVDPQAMAQPAPPTAQQVPQQPRVLLHTVPGSTHLLNPIGIAVGEPHDIFKLPDGREVITPHEFSQSLTLSGSGLIRVPFFVAKVREFMQGLRIESRTGKNDKEIAAAEAAGAKLWGYYSHPVREKSEQLEVLDKKINSVARVVRRATRTQNQDRLLAAQQELAELTAQRDAVANMNYSEMPPLIVVNKEVAQGGSPTLIGTLVHEFGHAIAAMNKGWRTGPDPAMKMRWAPGLDSSFWVAMSNFYQTMDSLYAWAKDPANGVDMAQLNAESLLISRLWRPVPEARLKMDPQTRSYRESGAELVADIVSVALHRPDILEQYAPTLNRAMEVFLNGRDPAARDFYEGIKRDIRDGVDMDEAIRLLNEIDREDRGLDLLRDSAKSDAKLSRQASGFHKIVGSLFDDFNILWQTARNLPASIHNAVQRLQYAPSIKKAYHVKVHDTVIRPLQELGLDNAEIGILLSAKRIMHDPTRTGLFNSVFGDVVDANMLFDKLIESKRLNHAQVEGILEKYNEVRQGSIVKLMKESGLFGDDFLALIENNKWYVRFESMDHAQREIMDGIFSRRGRRGNQSMTAGEAEAMKQTGTLGNYRNSLAATLAYDNFLFDMVLRETALKQLISHSIRTKELPVLMASQFETIAQHAPRLMQGYSKAQFSKISLPTRVLDTESGRYFTIRQEYMVPTEPFSPFFGAPNVVKKFMSDAATLSMSDLIKAARENRIPGGRIGLAFTAAIKGAQKINNTFRSFVILWNMGFQVANFFVYDPVRSMINMSGEIGWGSVKIIPEVLRALPAAIRSSFGDKLDPAVMELYERGILTTKQEFLEQMGSTDMTDRLMVMYGAKGYRNRVQPKLQNSPLWVMGAMERAWNNLQNFAANMANTTETASKLAAETLLARESSMSQAERDVFVRTMAGSPAYGIKGQLTPVMNMVFPFFNAIAQALRADWRAFKAAPEAVGIAMATFALPSIIQGLAVEGALDDAFDSVMDMLGLGRKASVSDIMRTAGSLEMSNNWIIPWGYNEANGHGRRITLPMPQNPAIKLIHNLSMNTTRGLVKWAKESPDNKEAQSALSDLLELAVDALFGTYDAALSSTSGITPQLSPAIRIADKASDIISKGNYSDEFRGGMAFKYDLMDRGEKTEALGGMVLKEMGVPKSFRSPDKAIAAFNALNDPDPNETDESANQKFIEFLGAFPLIGDGFNRMFKSNNAGYEERSARELKRKAHDKALASRDVEKFFEASVNSDEDALSDLLPRLDKHMERGLITKQLIKTKQKKQNIKDIPNIYLKRIKEDGTNESVDDLLRMNGKNEAATEAYNFLYGGRK